MVLHDRDAAVGHEDVLVATKDGEATAAGIPRAVVASSDRFAIRTTLGPGIPATPGDSSPVAVSRSESHPCDE